MNVHASFHRKRRNDIECLVISIFRILKITNLYAPENRLSGFPVLSCPHESIGDAYVKSRLDSNYVDDIRIIGNHV